MQWFPLLSGSTLRPPAADVLDGAEGLGDDFLAALQVVGVQDMSLLALPFPNHPVRQDDAVLVVDLLI